MRFRVMPHPESGMPAMEFHAASFSLVNDRNIRVWGLPQGQGAYCELNLTWRIKEIRDSSGSVVALPAGAMRDFGLPEDYPNHLGHGSGTERPSEVGGDTRPLSALELRGM